MRALLDQACAGLTGMRDTLTCLTSTDDVR
jgi:hypothetical protein